MYLTIHTPISLIIGSQINQPIWAFVLAFVFHLILDIIPHDPLLPISKNKVKTLFIKGLVDFFILFILLLILYKTNNLNFSYSILLALLGGILPDVLLFLNLLTKKKIYILKKFDEWIHFAAHTLIRKKYLIPIPWAVISQISVFIITLWIYLKII